MNIKIVKFNLKDSNFIFKLRNQKDVRRNSINKETISISSHKIWLKKINISINHKIYIIRNFKRNLGYLRLVKTPKIRNWEVSIALLKKFRKKGLAKKALILIEKKIKNCNFSAKVLKGNLNSLSLFLSCGYFIESENKNFYYMKKNKTKKINYESIINQIESIRKKNNKNWMDILRIAFKFSPKETAKTMSLIYKEDRRISKLSKKLK